MTISPAVQDGVATLRREGMSRLKRAGNVDLATWCLMAGFAVMMVLDVALA